MIVQLDNITEVNILLINHTTEHRQLTPVTVEVEENSTYHVTILSLEGNVIVHSAIIHSIDQSGVSSIYHSRIYCQDFRIAITHNLMASSQVESYMLSNFTT